jgi:hemerythrin superfamily protein
MKDSKPIKRHPSIVELSKDHHFALLLVWKIRQGLSKSIEPPRISKYVVHFFDTDLIQHFNEEEKFLFSKLPANNELRIQAEDEHRQIKEIIDDLRVNSTDKDLLVEFATVIEGHIRFEERKLFNHLQENIPENELAEIASSLNARKHEEGTVWEDTFWSGKRS